MTSGTGVRGPRSAQRRGPKAARNAVVQTDPSIDQGRRPAGVPDGGYPIELSDQHLRNFQRHFLKTGDTDTYFRVTRALVVAARRWRKLANERIRAIGHTMARWETLFLVGFSGEALTQGELARLVSVEGSSMVHMLDALARAGLIERQQSEVDRRVTTNRITPAGRAAVGEIMDVTNGLREELLRDIDPGKLAVANDVLAQILRKLDDMR